VPITGGLGVLRGALRRAGYTTEALTTALRTPTLSASPADRAVGRLRLAGREDAFATLVRLFVLVEPVREDELDAAVAPLRVADLAQAGLVAASEVDVRALVRIVPHGDVYVIADAPSASTNATPADHVAGVQGPSVTLANLTVRRPVRSALDVGTGNGIQAILASEHAARVVATDVNARALAFAQAGAALNGVTNIEFREGSGFEPVAGERFDLVVANPPYVISPESAYAFRDSGLRGDAISRQFVQEAPRHLEEGGFAHLLVSWIADPYGHWDATVRGWLEGAQCDAWLLHHETDDPLTHASKWLRTLAEESIEEYEAALERWLAYLDELGATGIATGAVVLRRRSGGGNWIRIDEFPARFALAGDQVLDVFAAADLLAAGGDDALLAAKLELHPAHTVRSTVAIEDGWVVAREYRLRSERGLGFDLGLDDAVIRLLPRFDGAASVRGVLAAAAADAEVPGDQYAPAALAVVRRLFELGYLRAPG